MRLMRMMGMRMQERRLNDGFQGHYILDEALLSPSSQAEQHLTLTLRTPPHVPVPAKQAAQTLHLPAPYGPFPVKPFPLIR